MENRTLMMSGGDAVQLIYLSQRILDTLDQLIVVRGRAVEDLYHGRGILSSQPKIAPIYYHIPKTWLNEQASLQIIMYCGCRVESLILDTPDMGEQLRRFFSPHDRELTDEQVDIGYVNRASWSATLCPILYVRKDCIHCCHMKPLVIALNRRSPSAVMCIFDVSQSDFPERSPVVRAVPQLFDPAVGSLRLISDLSELARVLNRILPPSEKDLRVLVQDYVCKAMPAAYETYMAAALDYYKTLLPAEMLEDSNTRETIAVDLELRADTELCLWADERMEAGDYLRFMHELTAEFASAPRDSQIF